MRNCTELDIFSTGDSDARNSVVRDWVSHCWNFPMNILIHFLRLLEAWVIIGVYIKLTDKLLRVLFNFFLILFILPIQTINNFATDL